MSLKDYYRYSFEFNNIEREYLKNEDVLVGLYNLPPLAYTNKNNNVNAGILVDYLSQIGIETGSEVHIKVEEEAAILEKLKKHEIDLALFEDNENIEKQGYIYTQPLCKIQKKIVVPNDGNISNIKDLTGKKVAIIKTDKVKISTEKLLSNILKLEIIVVDNIYESFALLDSKKIDGFLGSDMEIQHFLNVTNKIDKYDILDHSFDKTDIVFAMNKENIILYSIINKGILRIKRKDLIAKTQYKWLGRHEKLIMDLKTILAIYKIGFGIFTIVSVFSVWNYLITRKVNTRTRELIESKEELRLIIDKIKSGIIVMSRENLILECNDNISQIIAVNREEIIGRNYKSIEILRKIIDRENFNSLLRLKNKIYYTKKQIMTDNKSMIIVEDYTENYMREIKQRQESKMITMGKLSAGLSHEIRNPLGLIKSYTYVLSKYEINDMGNHAINIINESIDRINNLIENLLRFSKLSKNNLDLINVNEEIEKILGHKAGDSSVSIYVKYLTKEFEIVRVNDEILRMAVENLLGNSIESFEAIERKNKMIKISLEIIENYLNIEVVDNGCGIEKNLLDEVFDPFYSTKVKGTGLGLYILSTEIYNNKGDISVESVVNEGTKFKIKLPIVE